MCNNQPKDLSYSVRAPENLSTYHMIRNSTDFSLTSANKPQSSLLYICKFEVNRDGRTRCTNSWSNLTLKCKANAFVKVDTRIKENCRRTISYLQGYSCMPKVLKLQLQETE